MPVAHRAVLTQRDHSYVRALPVTSLAPMNGRATVSITPEERLYML